LEWLNIRNNDSYNGFKDKSFIQNPVVHLLLRE
jgi:hypothetical protein